MEEVVRRILQIEETAQETMNQAIQDKKEKEDAHQKRLSELQARINREAERKVRELREMELAEAQQKSEQISRDCSVRIEEMEQLSRQNMENWIEAVTKAILS